MAPPLIALPLIWFLFVIFVLPFYNHDGFYFSSWVSCTLIFSLMGPVWVSYPARSFFPSPLRLFFSLYHCLLFSYLSFSPLVSPCHFAPDLLPLRHLSSFPPLSSLLWPAWAYCPARRFLLFYVLSYSSFPSILSFSAPLLCSSPPSSLSFLSYFISSQPLPRL